MTHGECLTEEEMAPFDALLPEDVELLKSTGWVPPHLEDVRSCASGCAHCIVCDPNCSADWGLYM